MRLLVKDPSSKEPRGFDWTAFLAELADDETITTSTWSIGGPDSDLTIVTNSIVEGSRKTQLVLSGGTVGKRYTVTNSIVTSSGVEDDRSFRVLVQQR